jgi:hypothetical protein
MSCSAAITRHDQGRPLTERRVKSNHSVDRKSADRESYSRCKSGSADSKPGTRTRSDGRYEQQTPNNSGMLIRCSSFEKLALIYEERHRSRRYVMSIIFPNSITLLTDLG